jgi:hypothetical protein
MRNSVKQFGSKTRLKKAVFSKIEKTKNNAVFLTFWL